MDSLAAGWAELASDDGAFFAFPPGKTLPSVAGRLVCGGHATTHDAGAIVTHTAIGSDAGAFFPTGSAIRPAPSEGLTMARNRDPSEGWQYSIP